MRVRLTSTDSACFRRASTGLPKTAESPPVRRAYCLILLVHILVVETGIGRDRHWLTASVSRIGCTGWKPAVHSARFERRGRARPGHPAQLPFPTTHRQISTERRKSQKIAAKTGLRQPRPRGSFRRWLEPQEPSKESADELSANLTSHSAELPITHSCAR
jgi:hypothetical protein